jgi:phospholipase C
MDAHPMTTSVRAAFSLLTALGLGACSSQHAPASAPGALLPLVGARAAAAKPSGKITHVVIVIQENRSFDDLFQGYPGADTVPSGQNSMGQTIPLAPVSLATSYTIDHSAAAFLAACDGKPRGQNCAMDGFDKERSYNGPPNPQYAYVPHAESKPYFDIAKEFVLSDRTFTSQIDESFVAHQYLIAGQASSSVDLPATSAWGCGDGKTDTIQTLLRDRNYGPSELPCFNNQTLGDELDDAGLTWRFYTSTIDGNGGEWSGYQAIRHIRDGPDWAKDVITPQTRFLTDIASGTLENVTWITPICKNSDHVGCGGKMGPHWVATLVNAVGESQFWDSTAVFVIWDDWGGVYDHVPPPYADYDGLGIRVPMLVVSAYAKKNFVSHVQYETSSILRFAEDQFGLARLAASDRRATSPQKDCFDFSRPPRAFVPIPSVGRAFFLQQQDDHRPPDDQ